MQLPSFLRRKPPAQSEPQSAVTLNSPGWLSSWGNGGIPLFGNSVTEETAMAVAAVYRCVTLISGTIASLDLGVYTDDPVLGQVPVVGRLTGILTNIPFPGRAMTSFTLIELMVTNLLLHGDAFAAIRYDQAGRIVALEWIAPWMVRINIIAQRNIYTVTWPDGRSQETIDFENIVHVVGPGSYDGVRGASRIRSNARNSIALARSIEEVMGKAHDNAMAPKSVTTLPAGMSPDAMKRLQAFIDNEFSGKSNVGKNLLLDSGSTYESLSINVVDLALVTCMQSTTTQIAMFFGVPPLLLGIDQTTSFGSGISSLLIAFLRFGLNSDLERIEAELTRKLCSTGQYCLFDRSQLLQMDAAAAADVYAKEVSSGVSTVNEIRRRQHKPTVPFGDIPMTNSTNISLEQATQPRVPVPPAPPAAGTTAP